MADTKSKILLSIPEDLKKELEREAKKDTRSLNNYITTVLLKRDK